MNLTDNEIIKALECLAYWGECKQSSQCPYYMDNDIVGGCDNVTIAKETLDLINCKDVAIEVLKKDVEFYKERFKDIETTVNEFWGNLQKLSIFKGKETPTLEELLEYIEQTKAEAIKEYAEAVRKYATNEIYFKDYSEEETFIEYTYKLQKEMTGGGKQ